jgi:hypothetical protein
MKEDQKQRRRRRRRRRRLSKKRFLESENLDKKYIRVLFGLIKPNKI